MSKVSIIKVKVYMLMGKKALKSGQARVLSIEQKINLFDEILKHRHPEKNTAIMQISFKLGLRVQEIALLQIKEVARLGPVRKTLPRSFEIFEIMSLPAAYTKGADALNRSKSTYDRRMVSFSKERFDQVVTEIEALAKANAEIDPEMFYPPVKKHKGKSRDLKLADPILRQSLENYLYIRLEKDPNAHKTDPLFITQKGGSYSPNSLQDHMGLMLKYWARIEKASSHSGRRTLITDIIHKQGKSVKVAQKIAGHVSPSTTIIYEEPPPNVIDEALKDVGWEDE